jgi:beta-lactamase class A
VAFPEQISPGDCSRMLELLSRNKIGVLIEAGVPDGTRVAHKHGWTEEAAGLGALGDAAVVFTPGGDYVLAVFLWKENGMVWERDSKVVADLSRATYNYFNLPTR